MKKLCLYFLTFALAISCYGQNYNFQGTISREVLNNYLDRAITMQGQSDIEGTFMLSETERLNNISMLNSIGAKFIGRIAGWWENGWGQINHDYFFAKCSTNVANIHANDPQAICQAAVFEYVSETVNTFQIPSFVFTDLGMTPVSRNFVYSSMLYPAPASQYIIFGRPMSEAERLEIPDITQPETQLWFYYMATRYISVGCEAIHFGQAEIMNRRDIGNKKWWWLLQKIRQYASTINRGIVICDAHVPCGGMYYYANSTMNQSQWNSFCPIYDPSGQLLFDFHSSWVNFNESTPCSSAYQPATFSVDPSKGLHGRSLGGISPQGWTCARNPYLVEFDNGGVATQVGCNYNKNQDWLLWGWDEISWFAQQPEAKRNDIIKYAYYKTKCLDINGHLEMPGMREVTPGGGNPNWLYRANTGYGGQATTIASIWNGTYKQSVWNYYNFTNQISTAPDVVKKSLVFIGNNKMYYIASDKRIHGYVLNNGVWTVEYPYTSAQLLHGQNIQIAAENSLIASPDGSKLYYIGADGYLHGYILNGGNDYTYFDMPTSQMVQQNIKAVSDLIPSGNNRLFYIAKGSDQIPRVHGFYLDNGQWLTVSPTFSAQIFYGQSANTQDPAAGNLVLSPDGTKLYYRGTSGYMFGFNIVSLGQYMYFAMPTAQQIQQNVKVAGTIVPWGTDRIYYIGAELPAGTKRIHGFYKSGSQWLTISPSWSANANGTNISLQVQADSTLSISPDGQRIAYIGTDKQVHGFNVVSLGTYTYMDFKNVSSPDNPTNSLVMRSKDELFYIGNQISSMKVHTLKYEETYCGNTTIQAIEPGFTARVGFDDTEQEEDDLAENLNEYSGVTPIYPNPANDRIFFKRSGGKGIVNVSVVNIQGIKVKEISFDNTSDSSEEIAIDAQSLTNGLYNVLISSEGGSVSHQKVLIMH